ncbi:hypothetical protein ACIQGW_23645 [Lysinibacillus xylanilyticus]|uniref:hypothetical protein n=1 Tax=Lysinibacillus xylanilyticus TaxID=582475 RepID=UPI003809194A
MRKRSANVAAAKGFYLRETKRQHDVGHEGAITGRDAFSLRFSIANPQGVTQPSLQSIYTHGDRYKNIILNFDDVIKSIQSLFKTFSF